MHSLLGERQRRCNLIIEPRLVNTSFVGTACSVHKGKAHCQNLKAFTFIWLYILLLWTAETQIHATCDTNSIRVCFNCSSVCSVSFQTLLEIWLNS